MESSEGLSIYNSLLWYNDNKVLDQYHLEHERNREDFSEWFSIFNMIRGRLREIEEKEKEG